MCETDGGGSTQLEAEMVLAGISAMCFVGEDLLEVSTHVSSQYNHELLSMVAVWAGTGLTEALLEGLRWKALTALPHLQAHR